MSIAPIVPAIALRNAERRVVEQLQELGAVTPASATALPDLSAAEEQQLRMLCRASAVVEVTPGRYYLDPSALATFEADRDRGLLYMGAILIAVFGAIILFSS